jgi:GNAT superfamily N-acetyltransferase
MTMIRDLDVDRDAAAVVDVFLAGEPLIVSNAAEWAHRHKAIPPRAKKLERAAVVDGRLVGFVQARLDFFGSGDIGRIGVNVHPDYRHRGIGSELYDVGLMHLRSLGVSRMATAFMESPDGVSFAKARSWREERAEVLAVVDPADVDVIPGVSAVIKPVRELDPHELHRIDEETTRDIPSLEVIESIPYEEWLAFVWDNPLFTRDGSVGAIVDGRLAAVSFLLANVEAGRAFSMFTGTSREYRGRGLALAVKVASASWAAAQGITQMITTNDERNAPMLAVNKRLGYKPAGRRVEYVLSTAAGTASSRAQPAPAT